MFPLLRYFSVASALAILAVTGALAFLYWQHSLDSLTRHTEVHNQALARAFSNTLWPDVSRFVTSVSAASLESPGTAAVRSRLDRGLRRLAQGLPVLKVKIYSRDGLTVYSSEPRQIGESKAGNALLEQAIEHGGPVTQTSFRDTFHSFDGPVTARYLVESYLPVRGADGEIEGVFELYTDVTRQRDEIKRDMAVVVALVLAVLALLYLALFAIVRRANRVLKEQYRALREAVSRREAGERRFADFAEAASDWLWEMGPDLRFTYLSDRVEEVTGVPVDFHIGKTREELAGEAVDSGKWRELSAKIERREPFRHFEYHRRGPDGALQYLTVSGKPVFDADGVFMGYRGSGNDITATRDALDRAHAAEQMLLTAIDSLDDAFVLYDAEDRLVLCNQKYKNYYPRSADLMQPGARYEDIIRIGAERGEYAAAVGRVDDWIEERLAKHRAGYNETEQALSDGRWLRVSERRTPDGGTVGFRVDITQLKHAQRDAEAANRAKSEFLAAMSHEIRTPMTGVMGFADMLLDDPLAPESAEKVKRIKESTDSLLTIINDILDISKLDAGKMEIERVDMDPRRLAEDVVAMFQQTCPKEKKGALVLACHVDDDVPETISADPTRLRQVLVNMVGNAVKFTDSGEVRLSCRHLPDQGMLEFQIADTGIGIAADTLPTLFEEFTQADASISRRYQGTGLGLSICKRLVELMGGEIGAESEEGRGSTFWFRVPFAAARGGAIATFSRRGRDARFVGSRPLSILVAEDNAINRAIVQSLLQAMGHETTFAENGAEAVERVRETHFDVILMDIRMPVMSGTDAARAIRALPGFRGEIPIVAVTADAMAENRSVFLDAGMNDCIGKPIDRAELAEAINKAIGEIVNMIEDDTADVLAAAGADGRVDTGFDFETVLKRLTLPRDKVVPLIARFCDQYDDVDVRLADLWRAGDIREAGDLAHTLKGVSATLGAFAVSEVAAKLEKAVRSGDGEFEPILENLSGVLAQTVAQMRGSIG